MRRPASHVDDGQTECGRQVLQLDRNSQVPGTDRSKRLSEIGYCFIAAGSAASYSPNGTCSFVWLVRRPATVVAS